MNLSQIVEHQNFSFEISFSESAHSRDCAAYGLRPIIHECIKSVTRSMIEDNNAIRFVNEYFTNLRQQATGIGSY